MTKAKTFTRILTAFLLVCMMLTAIPQLLPSAHAASSIKCYTIANSNTTVYSNTALTKKMGTIYPTDELTISQVTDKYVKATYGVTGSSKTKTGYISRSSVMLSTSGSTFTASGKITTYRRNSTSNSYGYIAKGDKCVILGTKGNYTQVKYPVSGGYKIAFVLSSQIGTQKSITVYRQAGQSWSSHYYGYASAADRKAGKHATIGSGGCGVLSIVNAVYYMNGKFINPITLADYSVDSKNRYDGGTYDSLTCSFCNAKGASYGIKFVKDAKTVADIKANLQAGNVAVVHVEGHFVAVVDYNASTGKYLVLDSAPAAKRGTSGTGYRWLTAKEFTGAMAYSTNTSTPVHVIAPR